MGGLPRRNTALQLARSDLRAAARRMVAEESRGRQTWAEHQTLDKLYAQLDAAAVGYAHEKALDEFAKAQAQAIGGHRARADHDETCRSRSAPVASDR